MARSVVWAEAAWDDLGAIRDYIARDSPTFAASFVREARDAARSLSHFAERGRKVPEFNHEHIRELIVGNYRLIYQLTESTVNIVGFVHGARDLRKLWERESRPEPND